MCRRWASTDIGVDSGTSWDIPHTPFVSYRDLSRSFAPKRAASIAPFGLLQPLTFEEKYSYTHDAVNRDGHMAKTPTTTSAGYVFVHGWDTAATGPDPQEAPNFNITRVFSTAPALSQYLDQVEKQNAAWLVDLTTEQREAFVMNLWRHAPEGYREEFIRLSLITSLHGWFVLQGDSKKSGVGRPPLVFTMPLWIHHHQVKYARKYPALPMKFDITKFMHWANGVALLDDQMLLHGHIMIDKLLNFGAVHGEPYGRVMALFARDVAFEAWAALKPDMAKFRETSVHRIFEQWARLWTPLFLEIANTLATVTECVEKTAQFRLLYSAVIDAKVEEGLLYLMQKLDWEAVAKEAWGVWKNTSPAEQHEMVAKARGRAAARETAYREGSLPYAARENGYMPQVWALPYSDDLAVKLKMDVDQRMQRLLELSYAVKELTTDLSRFRGQLLINNANERQVEKTRLRLKIATNMAKSGAENRALREQLAAALEERQDKLRKSDETLVEARKQLQLALDASRQSLRRHAEILVQEGIPEEEFDLLLAVANELGDLTREGNCRLWQVAVEMEPVVLPGGRTVVGPEGSRGQLTQAHWLRSQVVELRKYLCEKFDTQMAGAYLLRAVMHEIENGAKVPANLKRLLQRAHAESTDYPLPPLLFDDAARATVVAKMLLDVRQAMDWYFPRDTLTTWLFTEMQKLWTHGLKSVPAERLVDYMIGNVVCGPKEYMGEILDEGTEPANSGVENYEPRGQPPAHLLVCRDPVTGWLYRRVPEEGYPESSRQWKQMQRASVHTMPRM